MTFSTDESSGVSVIVVGPAADLVGGMASVVEQILALDFEGKYRAELFPLTFSVDRHEAFHGRLARHVLAFRQLGRAIRRAGAPIVHIHTCSGFSFFRSLADMCLSQRLGCRAVVHVHGATFDEFYDRAGAIRQRIIRWGLGRADAVVALSESWCGKLAAICPKARIVIIENAVARQEDEGSERDCAEACRFLLLARMDIWKGIDDLLDAAAELHAGGVAFELALAGPPGTAGDASVLDQKIRNRGLQGVVRYVGSVHGNEKSNLLRRTDVYIQPSHNEGLPIAVLEALSYGLPVIATRVGGMPDVIGDQREGLLVPPHAPERLAAAMRDLASSVDRRKAMSKAASILASARFSLRRLRDDLTSLYDEVLASARGGARHMYGARSGQVGERPVHSRAC